MADPDFVSSVSNFKDMIQLFKERDVFGDESLNVFINLLKDKIPFAITRVNDGEMSSFVRSQGQRFGRTQHTIITQKLIDNLTEVLSHRQHNYWTGIVCHECFPDLYRIAKDIVGDYEHVTRAVVFTNRNWAKFVSEFGNLVSDRNIKWIGSEDQNLSMLEKIYDIEKIQTPIKLPQINAWELYDKLKDKVDMFDEGDLVCLSCGPVSRVLIKDWFKQRPDITFMGVGSTFDPMTRNVWHACHRGWLRTGFNETKKCSGCN
ncbi:hypothetical protein CMI47_22020 [Candidatus Pacearchaeota archaeon]|nr:hypothetical protein [Candidatus Pacearchaeota archaeon]|tara:strand:- start:187 stop:969 length:783 start_codon:yes stop_codon:yes gene_type:complete